MSRIRCGHCPNVHESVAAVRRCALSGGRVSSTRVQDIGHVSRPAPATVGMYRKLGQIYRVDRWGGQAGLRARRLDRYVDSDGQTAYRYVPAAKMLSTLSQADRMDSEEIRAFGHLTGTCMRCAARLELPTSVAAGIGPVCATKI